MKSLKMKSNMFDKIKFFHNLVKFELTRLITDKTTWILLAIFVAITNASAFFMGGFLALNEASMASFLKFAPFFIVMFAFLLSFSKNIKDYKKANFIKNASLPVSQSTLVLAKFVANNTIGVIFILLSSSFIFSIFYLGSPDPYLVSAGVLACLLIFMLTFAITSFTNTISRSSFESFAYSALIMFVLCLTGIGAISTILSGILPVGIIEQLEKFNIFSSFFSISSGLVSFSDMFLFLSLTFMFLVAGCVFSNREIYKLRFAKTKVLILLGIIVFLNSLAYESDTKVDLTADKVYSISKDTQEIVKNLGHQKLHLTFYFSESNPNIPANYASFAEYIDKFLKRLASQSRGRIVYRKLDPELDKEFEIEALKDKIAEIPVAGGESIYAGISFKIGQKVESIPYISLNRKLFFEYDLASQISKFTLNNKTKRIGIITDMNLGKGEQMPLFVKTLLKRYQIDLIPVGYPHFPNYDLVINFVTPFSEPETIYGIDQYLVNGGKLLVFLDPLFRTAPEEEFALPDRRADDTAFNHVANILRFHGIDYDYNAILGDKSRAMSTNIPGIGFTNYPLWMLLTEREMNKTNPIFINLNNLIIPEGGFFTKKELSPGLEYTELLTSSPTSQVVSRALFNKVKDPKSVASRLGGKQEARTISFMVKGNFLSVYPKMPDNVKGWFEGAYSLKGAPKVPPHTTLSDKEGVIIGVADMDFMSDQFSTYGKKELDGSITKTPISDNQAFLTNLVDYLMSETELIGLRGKGKGLRTLTKVENLLIDDVTDKNFQESALVRSIELAAGEYESLVEKLKQSRTEQEARQISQLIFEKQRELVTAKRELKIYKRSLRTTVDNYIRKIAILNTMFAPLLLLILGSIYFLKRRISYKIS